ncbi:Crp/Fnr family transcriptional regulator [Allosphingosinicella flava]|uniref:Crp/Fnr family transcriptional regulator n=1 Tax=Allosphingosinicella flava TaxID=2771430 RepID=UPI001CF7987C|nr:Crp/Fnr family transcriptional regulator [Sphingosinicella flava]
MGSCLAERLSHYLDLTDNEHAALDEIEVQERECKRGTIIRREQDRGRELFVLRSGWLQSHVVLGDGSRQIMRFFFPGDIIGLSSLALDHSPETIVTVSDATIAPFNRQKLCDIFESHPRLAALIFTVTMAERVAMADRLASIGRTSARARVASILCEIFARNRVMLKGELSELQLPLTQEDLGDATGLTAVHVNRMMRGLVDDGLIARSGNKVGLIDEGRLAAEANFIDRYAKIDTSWLPPAR